jgi:hypothetical protein
MMIDDTQLFPNIYYDFIAFYLVLGGFYGQRETYLKELT